ncbi:hypothetical protein KC328_g17 [Hortaea werneckii]|nr:hypothetical protein KC328_g17 [Hortaea werneckii]
MDTPSLSKLWDRAAKFCFNEQGLSESFQRRKELRSRAFQVDLQRPRLINPDAEHVRAIEDIHPLCAYLMAGRTTRPSHLERGGTRRFANEAPWAGSGASTALQDWTAWRKALRDLHAQQTADLREGGRSLEFPMKLGMMPTAGGCIDPLAR